MLLEGLGGHVKNNILVKWNLSLYHAMKRWYWRHFVMRNYGEVVLQETLLGLVYINGASMGGGRALFTLAMALGGCCRCCSMVELATGNLLTGCRPQRDPSSDSKRPMYKQTYINT